MIEYRVMRYNDIEVPASRIKAGVIHNPRCILAEILEALQQEYTSNKSKYAVEFMSDCQDVDYVDMLNLIGGGTETYIRYDEDDDTFTADLWSVEAYEIEEDGTETWLYSDWFEEQIEVSYTGYNETWSKIENLLKK